MGLTRRRLLKLSGFTILGLVGLGVLTYKEWLPLFSPVTRLAISKKKSMVDRSKIQSAQTIQWQGQMMPVALLNAISMNPDRSIREKVWRMAAQRTLADRQKLNEHWKKQIDINLQFVKTEGYWEYLLGQQISSAEVHEFVATSRKAIVPTVRRIYQRWQHQMEIERLRPWDISASPIYLPFTSISPAARLLSPPFTTSSELVDSTIEVLSKVDLEFGQYLERMRRERLLDLESKKGKEVLASYSPSSRKISMSFVGSHSEFSTLVHEFAHAMHDFLEGRSPAAFKESLAFAMQMLADLHLDTFYLHESEVKQASIQQLEWLLELWGWAVLASEFSNWAYDNPTAARDPKNCDRKWSELYQELFPTVDWSGLEDVLATGWQRLYFVVHEFPFMETMYAIALLGAIQIWQNSFTDYSRTVAQLKQAMSLSSTQSLSRLFAAAGVDFRLDGEVVRGAIAAAEARIDELQTEQAMLEL